MISQGKIIPGEVHSIEKASSTAQGFVARSTDQGASFHIVSPNGLRPNPAATGGGDPDIITDKEGNAYFADLEGLLAVGVAVSNDQGNNWRENFLSSTLPLDHRQWLAVDNGATSATISTRTVTNSINRSTTPVVRFCCAIPSFFKTTITFWDLTNLK